jgi:hypothetical protein
MASQDKLETHTVWKFLKLLRHGKKFQNEKSVVQAQENMLVGHQLLGLLTKEGNTNPQWLHLDAQGTWVGRDRALGR